MPRFTNLQLGLFQGVMDEVRIWDGPLNAAELADYMFAHRYAGGPLPEGCLAEFSFDEGLGNTGSVSGAYSASIVVEDEATLAESDRVWCDAKRIIHGFDFDSMVAQQGEGSGSSQ